MGRFSLKVEMSKHSLDVGKIFNLGLMEYSVWKRKMLFRGYNGDKQCGNADTGVVAKREGEL